MSTSPRQYWIGVVSREHVQIGTRMPRRSHLCIAGLLMTASVLSACVWTPLSTSELDRWQTMTDSRLEDYQREAVCSLHHVPTVATPVPAYGGMAVMPPKAYVRARIRRFPNSWLYVMTGWCTQDAPIPVVRWVCPVCRKAEMDWVRFHHYELPDDLSSTTGSWSPPSVGLGGASAGRGKLDLSWRRLRDRGESCIRLDKLTLTWKILRCPGEGGFALENLPPAQGF